MGIVSFDITCHCTSHKMLNPVNHLQYYPPLRHWIPRKRHCCPIFSSLFAFQEAAYEMRGLWRHACMHILSVFDCNMAYLHQHTLTTYINDCHEPFNHQILPLGAIWCKSSRILWAPGLQPSDINMSWDQSAISLLINGLLGHKWMKLQNHTNDLFFL